MSIAIKKEESLLDENILSLKPKDANVSIDGEVISLTDLEKIFFLSKISKDPSFISSVLKIDTNKINNIINSLRFQEVINEYLSEYLSGQAGESSEQLTLRYKDLLQECFYSLRVSIGLRIRESIENDKPLDGKRLSIPLIEKLMRLEFALHGLPIDIKGFIHANKKDSGDKTEAELLKSLNDIKDTIEKSTVKTFNPKEYSGEVEDIEIETDGSE